MQNLKKKSNKLETNKLTTLAQSAILFFPLKFSLIKIENKLNEPGEQTVQHQQNSAGREKVNPIFFPFTIHHPIV